MPLKMISQAQLRSLFRKLITTLRLNSVARENFDCPWFGGAAITSRLPPGIHRLHRLDLICLSGFM